LRVFATATRLSEHEQYFTYVKYYRAILPLMQPQQCE
jgi:hypothetical protein